MLLIRAVVWAFIVFSSFQAEALAGAYKVDKIDLKQIQSESQSDKLIFEKKKSELEYWAATGLQVQNYFDDVTDHCYDNIRSFRGCYEGLSFVAGYSVPGGFHQLATEEEKVLGNPALGDAAGTLIGELKLYKSINDEKVGLLETKARTAKRRGIREQTMQKLFAASASARLDFKALIGSIAPKIFALRKDVNLESYVAALLYNLYLGATDDPHSRLSPTAQEEDMMSGGDETELGVNVQLRLKAGKWIVKNVAPNSTADKYGLKRGDQILQIADESTEGVEDADWLMSRLNSTKGGAVKIKISRGGQTYDGAIPREQISTKTLEAKVVAHLGVPYGWIIFRDFMDKTAPTKIAEAIAAFEEMKVKGLILDLRGNLGGLLDSAVSIGGLFVGKKEIVSVLDFKSGKKRATRSPIAAITSLPAVVLINNMSASASEILAGALQDHNRAWVVGDRSFGKGSVQGMGELYPFSSYTRDRGKMPGDATLNIRYRKTMARFYQPSGRTNQIEGILPSFHVDPYPDASELEKVAYREEDAYTNALPALNAPWAETRPDQVAQINACRSSQRAADKAYAAADASDSQEAPDYQLMNAEEILKCSE